MDPMVGSSATTDGSDNAELLDFCFLCSRQFFHDNLDNYGTERLKDEDVLETFFEELGPVDRALLQCCPSCQALCRTLTRTKEALSSLIDEITNLLLQSRKVAYLLSKSRVVNRLFQSSNISLPPCEVSTSYFPNFSKDIATAAGNNCFPSQFNLKLDSSNLSVDDLTIGSHSNTSSIIKKPLFPLKPRGRIKQHDCNPSPVPVGPPNFSSAFRESIMNDVSDNACDASENGKSQVKNEKVTKSDKSRGPATEKLGDVQVTNEVINPVVDSGDGPKIKNVYSTRVESNDKVGQAKVIDGTNETERPSKDFHGSSQGVSSDKKKISRQQNPLIASKTKLQVPKYKCDICSKLFKKERDFQNHVTFHKSKRPYICEKCGVSYRHKIGLDNHVLLHKAESKFKCDVCLKSFTQNIGLQRHMRIHAQSYQFKCDDCGKEFIHHSSFQTHKLAHQGNKPFSCSICDMKFLQKSHLQRHERIHTGGKSHTCTICSRSFSEKYNLLAHIKSHYNETKNSHKCSKCSKSYTRKLKLKQHMQQVHGMEM